MTKNIGMDVFCVRTQIFLIIICLPMLDYLRKKSVRRNSFRSIAICIILFKDMAFFAQTIQSQRTSLLGFSAYVREKFHVSISIWRIYQCTKSNNNDAQNIYTYPKGIIHFAIDLGVSAHVRKKFPRLCKNICVYAQIIQRWKTLLSKITIRNFCACTQKTSTFLVRICVYAQIIQRWKTMLYEIVIRNFCACTQKSSTYLLRIFVYA